MNGLVPLMYICICSPCWTPPSSLQGLLLLLFLTQAIFGGGHLFDKPDLICTIIFLMEPRNNVICSITFTKRTSEFCTL